MASDIDNDAGERHAVPLHQLFFSFLKIGATGFGGPFALLALLEQEIVKRRAWFTPEQYTEAVAVGQTTPGPVFSGAAFYTGYRLRGLVGALVVALAGHLPGFLLAVLAAALYLQFQNQSWVSGASRGIGAAVIGLLLAVTLRTGRSVIKEWRAAVLAAGAFIAVVFARIDPILVILAAVVVGLLALRPSSQPAP